MKTISDDIDHLTYYSHRRYTPPRRRKPFIVPLLVGMGIGAVIFVALMALVAFAGRWM